MVRLGTCIAASGAGRPGKRCMAYRIGRHGAQPVVGELAFGQMLRVPLAEDEEADVEIVPVRGVDVGAGSSSPLARRCRGGEVGIVLDARGRPLQLADDESERRRQLVSWLRALDLYPDEAF